MTKNASDSILLVGTGPMAIEYAKVLKSLETKIVIVGRGNKSARQFSLVTNLPVQVGGIGQWLKKNSIHPQKAIIAVSENELGNVTLDLLMANFKYLLVEKPGGSDYNDIKLVAKVARKKGTKIYIGYNRRFYASTIAAEKIINEDGGVTSFSFEFTEWGHIISQLKKAPGIKENWLLHNSTHIIDLAFFLGGQPQKISAYVAGGLSWHKKASIFAGAGITKRDVLFSYQANWEAPGRWGVEVLTRKHRLVFRPIEKLQIQQIGSVIMEPLVIHDSLDVKFKPGLYKQVKSFLTNKTERLCSIEEQIKNLDLYQLIGGRQSDL